MRNGQNKQRMRNNRGGGGGGGHNQNRRGGQNPLTRVYESNGPEIKIRGTASHIAEKYLQLARDAQSSGDPVSAENYFQHAEHYFRIIAAAQEQFRQNQPQQQQPQQRMDNDTRDENAEDVDGEFSSFGNDQGGQPREPQPYPMREPQPYQMREQNQQPREQQNWRDNRNDNRSENRNENRNDNRSDNRNDNRNQPQPAMADDRDIDRLPSFITGGQQQPNVGGNNNYDNGGNGERGNGGDRGDRYPHRRRRRHHGGPRPDNQMSQPVSNDDFGSGGD
jgi:hypothetical protein